MDKPSRSRILVVDDHADSANVMAVLLRLWGHDAVACYDGDSALEAARTYQPHVLLLDIAMPGVDGFQVARGLRGQPGQAGTLVIGVSGYGDEAVRRRAREAGFDHCLLKPVEPAHLQELLGRAAPDGKRSGRPEAADTFERPNARPRGGSARGRVSPRMKRTDHETNDG